MSVGKFKRRISGCLLCSYASDSKELAKSALTDARSSESAALRGVLGSCCGIK
jgi:uncharacterized Fe-S cluster-containing MiaB family protein